MGRAMPNVATEGVALARRSAGGGYAPWFDGVILGFASLVLFLLCTRHGIGILPDSTRYFGIIEAPYDAPLYPWMLAVVTFLGVSIESAAKIVGLLVVCANAFLVWLLIFRTTGKRTYAAGGTALAILSPLYVAEHSVAMSEPTFILFILLTLLALLEYWKTENRVWLVWCGVALGAAALARFTAPPLGAAIALSLLVSPRRPFSRRFVDAVILAVVSGAIFFLWMAGSQLTEGRSIGRPLAFHGNMDLEAWLTSLTSFTSLFLPTQVPFLPRVAVLAFIVVVAAYLCWWQSGRALSRPDGEKSGAMLPSVLGLFFICYIAFLLLAFWVEANQLFTPRYLFPVYVTSVIMMAITLAFAGGEKGAVKWLHHLAIAVALVVLAGHLVRTGARTHESYVEGVGYASVEWRQSPTTLAAAKLPADATLYSNGWDALGFVLKRLVHMAPAAADPRTEEEFENSPLAEQIDTLRHDLAEGNTYVVFYDAVDWRHYLVPEGEVVKELDLKLVEQLPDGRIYSSVQAAPQAAQ